MGVTINFRDNSEKYEILQELLLYSYAASQFKNELIFGYQEIYSSASVSVFRNTSNQKIVVVIKSFPFKPYKDTNSEKLYGSFFTNQKNIELFFNSRFSESEVVKLVKNEIKKIQISFPKSEYTYFAVGHDIGGAIIDNLIQEEYINKGISFNPLIEKRNWLSIGFLFNHDMYYDRNSPYCATFAQNLMERNVIIIDSEKPNLLTYRIYQNPRTSLIANSVDNKKFYKGPGRSFWKHLISSLTTKYQIVSDGYFTYFSEDSGISWRQIGAIIEKEANVSDPELFYGKFYGGTINSDGNKIIVLVDSFIYLSTDKGKTFNVIKDIGTMDNNIDVQFFTNGTDNTHQLFIITKNNSTKKCWTTKDGGVTWTFFLESNTPQKSNEKIWFAIDVLLGSLNVNSFGDYPLSTPEILRIYYEEKNGIKYYKNYVTDYNPPPNNGLAYNFWNIRFLYQSVIGKDGFIYTSSDFGLTWKPALSAGNHSWTNITMDGDGEIQVATFLDKSNYSCGIVMSSDYGKTWTLINNDRIFWYDIKILGSGSYQVGPNGEKLFSMVGISQSNIENYPNKTEIQQGGYVWISRDSGKTWIQRK